MQNLMRHIHDFLRAMGLAERAVEIVSEFDRDEVTAWNAGAFEAQFDFECRDKHLEVGERLTRGQKM